MSFIQLKEQATYELIPGYKGRFIHTQHNSCLLYTSPSPRDRG